MDTNTPSPTFFIPQGNFYEAKFYNLVQAKKIEDAHQLLLNHGKYISVNTTIKGKSLIAHAIDEFLHNDHEDNVELYNGLILLMCYMRPDLNQYDEENEATLFTQLFSCDIYPTTLTFILKNVPVWINPEEDFPQNQKITKTPLGEAASNFDKEQVLILCKAGANPNSQAYSFSGANDIIDYTLTVAADNDYFKDTNLTKEILEIVEILFEHGAAVNAEHISFISDEYTDNPHNSVLPTFIQYLESGQPTHTIER